MTIRNRILSGMVGLMVSFIMVLVIILLWTPISELIGGINVGLMMFFNDDFWTFTTFFLGLTFILTLVIGFVVRTRWGSRPI